MMMDSFGLRMLLKGFVYFCTIFPLSLAACGYKSCPVGKPNMLNVHIICHSHDDVGWVQTVDAYYDIYVRRIITSVINSLLEDENRKFIYVESAYFHRWWNEQSTETKLVVKDLINDGQLEIISGGWSMNDEATTHYLAIIDQMTLGMRWLNDTFGSCATPRVGWQIDPFGHSREQASLFAQMNFDGLFLGRIDYQDKEWREQTKTLEFLWKTHPGYGPNMNIFTGILPNVYWPPSGFCFDSMCADEHIADYNIHRRSEELISIIKYQATHYLTNHTVLTMGMDFHYTDSDAWYRNLNMLIHYINNMQDSSIHMFYSTPSCYLNSLYKSNITWPTYTKDFFPYASNPHAYWTGFYTSKPAIKRYTRHSNAFLQACKQVVTLSNMCDTYSPKLKMAMGVLQHHDAVTGTEKDHVVKDYAYMLALGTAECEVGFQEAFRKLVNKNDDSVHEYNFCKLLNVSQCEWSEDKDKFVVIAYNPLARNVTEFIRIPVTADNYVVRDFDNNSLPFQIVPIPHEVQVLPERTSSADKELIFKATIPPLGTSIYEVLQDNNDETNDGSFEATSTVNEISIGNENIRVVIDSRTGLITEMVLDDLRIPFRQSFHWYEAQPGYSGQTASGAYAFNPKYDYTFSLNENVTFRINKGTLVEEVHQTFTPWLSQTIRVYKGQQHVEFDWIVGPIPTSRDHVGKEIITLYETSLATEGEFYTDVNGRQTMKRKRNDRPYPHNITERVTNNYYPINSWIHIKDENRKLQLTIIPDRAQGASSIYDGAIEIMLHRRLLYDDYFGVEEPLNELGVDGRGLVVRGKHWLLLRPTGDVLYRELAQRMFLEPILSFSDGNINEMVSLNKFSGLKNKLPPNIHLLTLESLGSEILLRLENFYGFGEHPVLSRPANVSLAELFSPFSVLDVRETALGANVYLNETDRLSWNNEDLRRYSEESFEELTFSLQPMQIRTFILKISDAPSC